jgi:hypothetical protein
VPPDYRNDRIAVRGVSLPGDRVVELRAAMHSFVLGLIDQDRYLRQFTTRQIRLSQDRLALRSFVDDGLHLVALIDEFVPVVRVNGAHDLLALVKDTVREVHDGCCT